MGYKQCVGRLVIPKTGNQSDRLCEFHPRFLGVFGGYPVNPFA